LLSAPQDKKRGSSRRPQMSNSLLTRLFGVQAHAATIL
jgi:hypothetical protein